MKNLTLSLIIFIISLAFFSCKKLGNSNDASADVFVRSLIFNGNPAFSVFHSVTSYNGMTSVTVETPDGISFKLKDRSGIGVAFLKDTSMVGATYSDQPPVSGVYTYHVTFSDGEQKVYTNTLSDQYLLPPVIDSLYKKPDNVRLRLKWAPLAGAQTYEMRILSGTTEIMPWFEFGDPSGFYYERLISNFANWLPGTLIFELRGVSYESSDHRYVQALSITSASIDL